MRKYKILKVTEEEDGEQEEKPATPSATASAEEHGRGSTAPPTTEPSSRGKAMYLELETDDDESVHTEETTAEDQSSASSSSTDDSQSKSWLCGCFFQEYWRVLVLYPNFRVYILQDLLNNLGDYLVRISSLLVLQEWSGTGAALSHYFLCTLLPKAFCAPIGGILSDYLDRRNVLIGLNVCSGLAVLGYLLAIQQQSLVLLYMVTIFRSALSSLQYPVVMGIFPMFVPDPHDLQLAVTMTSWSWGCMSLVGGPLAGTLILVIGYKVSYAIDSATYFVNALALYLFIKGNFCIRHRRPPAQTSSPLGDEVVTSSPNTSTCCKAVRTTCRATVKVFRYLATCGFGLLVFLKATGSLIWGPEDVVGVEFATVRYPDGAENEAATSPRMGLLFAIIGFGYMMGPTLSNTISNAKQPLTVQRTCWLSFWVSSIGWTWISLAPNYYWFLPGTVIRTIGSGMIYQYSTLLLQGLCQPEMLGRVLSIEYILYELGEALSASLSGWIFDATHESSRVSLFGLSLAIGAVIFWGVYHYTGHGAAAPGFNKPRRESLYAKVQAEKEEKPPVSSLEMKSNGERRKSARVEMV